MKLFRSDLIAELSDTLFEIPANELKAVDIKFTDSKISCNLTSEAAAEGYKISGTVTRSTIEICDRCLTEFPQNHELPISFWLTSNHDLISDENTDFIWFPDGQEWLDISSVIHDIIYLDEPIKTLCREDCKGMCSICGQNLNHNTCSCSSDQINDQWNELKKLKQ